MPLCISHEMLGPLVVSLYFEVAHRKLFLCKIGHMAYYCLLRALDPVVHGALISLPVRLSLLQKKAIRREFRRNLAFFKMRRHKTTNIFCTFRRLCALPSHNADDVEELTCATEDMVHLATKKMIKVVMKLQLC